LASSRATSSRRPSISCIHIWEIGFDAINRPWRYFLLGAVVVIPIWLLSRLFGSPRA